MKGVLNLAARSLWRLPACFGAVKVLGPSYSLRCIVFHDISPAESLFTKGMGVTTTPRDLEATLQFIAKHYTPVSLQDILADPDGTDLPLRPILVTFDDGYASVQEWAAPLCHKRGIPAIFFLNAAYLDNARLAPDNMICYVANVRGMETIDAAARTIKSDAAPLKSLADVFSGFLPLLSEVQRQHFLKALTEKAGISESGLAADSRLYLTRAEVQKLSADGFEIGNHTFSHIHCRTLSRGGFAEEIDNNQAELERLSGKAVQSFSVPYGSSRDLTSNLATHLKNTGHKVLFLSESAANPIHGDAGRLYLDRVGVHETGEHGLFCEIEVLPRLRLIRNRLCVPAYLPRMDAMASGTVSHR